MAAPVRNHRDSGISAEVRNIYQELNTRPSLFTGSGAPSFTPGRVGDEYLDIASKVLYKAFGTESASDWAAVGAWR